RRSVGRVRRHRPAGADHQRTAPERLWRDPGRAGGRVRPHRLRGRRPDSLRIGVDIGYRAAPQGLNHPSPEGRRPMTDVTDYAVFHEQLMSNVDELLAVAREKFATEKLLASGGIEVPFSFPGSVPLGYGNED